MVLLVFFKKYYFSYCDIFHCHVIHQVSVGAAILLRGQEVRLSESVRDNAYTF